MNYYYQAKTPIGASQEYWVRALELARRNAGNDLYSILYSQRLPAVVEIDESSTTIRDPFSREVENITTITISVTPVTHKHITMAHMDIPLANVPIWSEMKFRARKYIRELWYKIIGREQ